MQSFFQSLYRTIINFLGTLVGTLWLLGLYGFAVWLVVGSLTSIQIRDEYNARAAENPDLAVSFAEASRAQQRLLQQEAVINRKLETHPIPVIDNKRLLAVRDFESATFGYVYTSATNQIEQTNYAQDRDYYCQVFNEKGEVIGFDETSPSCTALDELIALDEEKQELIANDELVKFEEARANAQQQISALRANEPLADAIEVIEFFESLPLYNEFLKEPRELLVMQLTMAMGALGSVITMTWSFVRRDGTHTIRRFLMLPFVGAISAFVILVFLKAGQLTVTAGQSSDDLNPFVLSFVGIVSGLLSERAYARMSDVGNKFFVVEADIQRYAVRLKPELDAHGIDDAEVARVLKLKEVEEADKVIAGQKALSAVQQDILSALVRKPARELFSDQAPPVSA